MPDEFAQFQPAGRALASPDEFAGFKPAAPTPQQSIADPQWDQFQLAPPEVAYTAQQQLNQSANKQTGVMHNVGQGVRFGMNQIGKGLAGLVDVAGTVLPGSPTTKRQTAELADDMRGVYGQEQREAVAQSDTESKSFRAGAMAPPVAGAIASFGTAAPLGVLPAAAAASVLPAGEQVSRSIEEQQAAGGAVNRGVATAEGAVGFAANTALNLIPGSQYAPGAGGAVKRIVVGGLTGAGAGAAQQVIEDVTGQVGHGGPGPSVERTAQAAIGGGIFGAALGGMGAFDAWWNTTPTTGIEPRPAPPNTNGPTAPGPAPTAAPGPQPGPRPGPQPGPAPGPQPGRPRPANVPPNVQAAADAVGVDLRNVQFEDDLIDGLRAAWKRTHPDSGGDQASFEAARKASDILKQHYKGKLQPRPAPADEYAGFKDAPGADPYAGFKDAPQQQNADSDSVAEIVRNVFREKGRDVDVSPRDDGEKYGRGAGYIIRGNGKNDSANGWVGITQRNGEPVIYVGDTTIPKAMRGQGVVTKIIGDVAKKFGIKKMAVHNGAQGAAAWNRIAEKTGLEWINPTGTPQQKGDYGTQRSEVRTETSAQVTPEQAVNQQPQQPTPVRQTGPEPVADTPVGPYTAKDLGASTEAAWDSGGISSKVRSKGLRPAFIDRETGKIYESMNPPNYANQGDPATPAGVHILDGLPDEVVIQRDPKYPQEVLSVKASIEAGFIDEAGKYLTRDEASQYARPVPAPVEFHPKAKPIYAAGILVRKTTTNQYVAVDAFNNPVGGPQRSPVEAARAFKAWKKQTATATPQPSEAQSVPPPTVNARAEGPIPVPEDAPGGELPGGLTRLPGQTASPTTPPTTVADNIAPQRPPVKRKPAAPFTKPDIESRLLSAYQQRGDMADQERAWAAKLEEHGGPSSAFVFRRDPKTKSGFPGEIEHYLEGRPGLKASGKIRLATKPGEHPSGNDAMASLGDEYFQILDHYHGGKNTRAIDWARKSDNPQDQFLAALHDNLPARSQRNKAAITDPTQYPTGTKFKIQGSEFEVLEHEDGYRVLKDGDDYPVVPVDQVGEIPVDKGSVAMPRAEDADEGTGAVPDDPFGEFQDAPAEMQAKALPDDYDQGDRIQLTGKTETIHGGEFEEFTYLEGAKKGRTGVRPTKQRKDADVAAKQKAWQDQQDDFRRLRESAPAARAPSLSTGTQAAGGAKDMFGNPAFEARPGQQEAFGFKQDDEAARRERAKTYSPVIERKEFDPTQLSEAKGKDTETGEIFKDAPDPYTQATEIRDRIMDSGTVADRESVLRETPDSVLDQLVKRTPFHDVAGYAQKEIERRAETKKDTETQTLPMGEAPVSPSPAKPAPATLSKAKEYSIDRILDTADDLRASAIGKKKYESALSAIRTHAQKLGINVPDVGTYFTADKYRKVIGEIESEIAKQYGSHPTAKRRAIRDAVDPKRKPPRRSGKIDPAILEAPVKFAAKLADESAGVVVRGYSEPFISAMKRQGGKTGQKYANAGLRMASNSKDLYARDIETIDAGRNAVRKLGRASTWLTRIDDAENGIGVRNIVAATEGPLSRVPAAIREDVRKFRVGNLAVGKKAEGVIPGFKAGGGFSSVDDGGRLQRNFTEYGINLIQGPYSEQKTKVVNWLSSRNKIPTSTIRSMFDTLADDMSKGDYESATKRINQEFSRQLKFFPTSIKDGGWQDIIHSSPDAYLARANRVTSSRMAFLKEFPDGTESARQEIRDSGGDVKAFDNLVKAVHEMPLDMGITSTIAPAGTARRKLLNVGNEIASTLKTVFLTGSAPVNAVELITGSVPQSLGVRNAVAGAVRLIKGGSQYRSALEGRGMIDRAMYDWAFDTTQPIRSLNRIARNAIGELSGNRFLNELNEAHAAATADVVMDMAKAGKLKGWQAGRIKLVAESMGFGPGDAKKIVDGTAGDPLYNAFRRRAAAFLSGGNRVGAEGSQFQARRSLNELLPFQSYGIKQVNQMNQYATRFAEAVKAGDKRKAMQAAALFGRFATGTTVQGAAQGLFYAMLAGALGLAIWKSEAEDEPAEFVMESFLNGLAGPFGMIYRFATGSSPKGPLSALFPVSLFHEAQDIFNGDGQYRDQKPMERAQTFATKRVGGGRILWSILGPWAMGQQYTDMATAERAYYRWKNEEIGRQSFSSDIKDVDQQAKNDSFRMAMRKSFDAMKQGKPTDEVITELRKALDVKDDKAIKASLRTRRLIIPLLPDKNDTQDDLARKQKQLDSLKKRIGQKAFDVLVQRERILEAWIDAI
jgi:hypothetical protein